MLLIDPLQIVVIVLVIFPLLRSLLLREGALSKRSSGVLDRLPLSPLVRVHVWCKFAVPALEHHGLTSNARVDIENGRVFRLRSLVVCGIIVLLIFGSFDGG